MTADLSALIARLEAAEVGSRELDKDAMMALGYREVSDPRDCVECWRDPDGLAHYATHNITTSLDAALALAERVLPGCSPGMSQNVHSRDWFAWLGYAEDGEAKLHAQTFGKTPALALCLAVLKAKQGEKT